MYETPFSKTDAYTFLQILELLVVPSIQKRTRVSWLFIRHIKEKGGGSQGIKRGAEIDSCCDTTIQQATNLGQTHQ